MRIGLVCPYSLTVAGGVQGQVLGLARALRQIGVEARVLGPSDGPPPHPFVTPLGNSLRQSANGSIAPLAPDIPATLRTITALRDEEFDVVHLHEPIVPGPALTALLFCDQPLVGTFHRAGLGRWYSVARVFRPFTTVRLSARVAVSEQAALTAKAVFGDDGYQVLWNGIDVAAAQAAEPEPTRGPTVLFLGRHEERKGLDVLLDAFDLLPPDVRLWVAGEGPETARLVARTEGVERIEWLGTIAEDDKRRRLRGADVVCAPSKEGESFGVVLLEALAAGTPVVASDIDGYRNVMQGGVDGLLVPPGDAPALAAGLARALQGGPAVQRMTDHGLERAHQFSMPRLAERYLSIYEALAGSGRAITASRGA
ncbi:glycosyltransferase family 4 protein [Acidiferrimicrobium sp. IK]|nr:glycosyltransferase family 4 protein [Acidiferrimicrobium sp. IK]